MGRGGGRGVHKENKYLFSLSCYSILMTENVVINGVTQIPN